MKRIILGLIICAMMATPALARPSVLGTAENFAVLGGSAVTNTGNTIINGDLGIWPGSSIVGFPPGIVNGTIYASDAVALLAQSDLTTAYNTLAGMAFTQDLSGTDLGGLTLTSGVYSFSSSAGLTGALTLSGPGDFVFQIGSTLTTASGSSVLAINGVDEGNVVLAGRQLRDPRHRHDVRRKYSRGPEHHPDYQRRYSVR